MRAGMAADHGGFALKQVLLERLLRAGVPTVDFGANRFEASDDFPDVIVPLARAVVRGEVDRGIAICGSGVGACIVANKIRGARAALCTDGFSAHQGVEDDDMNIICIGARVVGPELAWELIEAFLAARFREEPRFRRRLDKVRAVEASGE